MTLHNLTATSYLWLWRQLFFYRKSGIVQTFVVKSKRIIGEKKSKAFFPCQKCRISGNSVGEAAGAGAPFYRSMVSLEMLLTQAHSWAVFRGSRNSPINPGSADVWHVYSKTFFSRKTLFFQQQNLIFISTLWFVFFFLKSKPAAYQNPQIPVCKAAPSYYFCQVVLHPKFEVWHFYLLNIIPLILA